MTQPDDNAFPVQTVICQGCECECEVQVALIDGRPVCLGGNNCPTGDAFACAVCARKHGLPFG